MVNEMERTDNPHIPSDPTYAQPALLSIFEPEWHISYSR